VTTTGQRFGLDMLSALAADCHFSFMLHEGRVAKRTVANMHDLKDKLLGALERLRTMPSLIAGFFRHPPCRYILAADAAA
jgi:hypothetical protein